MGVAFTSHYCMIIAHCHVGVHVQLFYAGMCRLLAAVQCVGAEWDFAATYSVLVNWSLNFAVVIVASMHYPFIGASPDGLVMCNCCHVCEINICIQGLV